MGGPPMPRVSVGVAIFFGNALNVKVHSCSEKAARWDPKAEPDSLA